MKIIDLHAHSSLQPYGQMFKKNPSKRDLSRMSLWFYNPPKFLKGLGEKLGLSAYSQANFFSAGRGSVRVVAVSLYPPEVAFFKNKLPSFPGNGLENMITRYSADRIDEIESGQYDYFKDIAGQYEFMQRFNQSESPNNNYNCVIAKSFEDIKTATSQMDTYTIVGVLNIEGGHALGCGYPKQEKQELTPAQKKDIIEHVRTIKNWEYPIFYLTFCHHFYNQLCGHSKSLPDILSKVIDQSYGENLPLTPFGEVVIEMLLDKNEGKRILIDIKHMSIDGRKRYLEMLANMKAQTGEVIPIIYSHGGANSRKDYDSAINTAQDSKLNPADLGLFDNEILAIADSGGIIGLNVDQRVMSSEDYVKKVKRKVKFKKKDTRKKLWSSIIWNNIQYIAEVLYRNGRNSWDYMAIGSDFDGAINPVNYFLQLSDMPELANYLQQHLEDYYQSTECIFTAEDRLDPATVIEKICFNNAGGFMERHFV